MRKKEKKVEFKVYLGFLKYCISFIDIYKKEVLKYKIGIMRIKGKEKWINRIKLEVFF